MLRNGIKSISLNTFVFTNMQPSPTANTLLVPVVLYSLLSKSPALVNATVFGGSTLVL